MTAIIPAGNEGLVCRYEVRAWQMDLTCLYKGILEKVNTHREGIGRNRLERKRQQRSRDASVQL
jgi:hypothetical protein